MYANRSPGPDRIFQPVALSSRWGVKIAYDVHDRIVHSFSRFFRDQFQFEFCVRKLAKNGVRLISITRTVARLISPLRFPAPASSSKIGIPSSQAKGSANRLFQPRTGLHEIGGRGEGSVPQLPDADRLRPTTPCLPPCFDYAI
jgi:hypothetical protein